VTVSASSGVRISDHQEARIKKNRPEAVFLRLAAVRLWRRRIEANPLFQR